MILAKQQEAWRRLGLVNDELAKGITVREALANLGLSHSFYYANRNKPPPGQEQAAPQPPPAPKAKVKAQPHSGLNFCPSCGLNLRAVNIAINITSNNSHE